MMAFEPAVRSATGGPVEHDEGTPLEIEAWRHGKRQNARIAGTFATAGQSTDGQTEEGC